MLETKQTRTFSAIDKLATLEGVERLKVLKSSKRGRHFLVYKQAVPFYLSSGHHSGHPGTWFPCLGIQDVSNPFAFFNPKKTHHTDGWVIKGRRVSKALGTTKTMESYQNNLQLSSLFNEVMNGKGKTKGIKSFFHRMSNSKAMAISAYLGGGIWETGFGKMLKSQLTLDFPQILSSPKPVFDFIEEDCLKKHYPDSSNEAIINQFIMHELNDSPFDYTLS